MKRPFIAILILTVFFTSWGEALAANKPAAPVVNGLHPVMDHLTAVDKIVVSKVVEGMPMEKAGVKVGDQIVSVDGHVFKAAEALLAYTTKCDKPTEFKFLRDGKEIVLRITPLKGERKFGFDANYFDNKKGQVFPKFVSYGTNKLTWSPDMNNYDYGGDAISEAQVSSYVHCAMMISKPFLYVLIDVGNSQDRDLDYKSVVSIYVTTEDGQLLKPLSAYESEQLVRTSNNPSAAYLDQISSIADKYQAMWQGKSGAFKDQELIPSTTHKRVSLKFDARGLTPPFKTRIEIRKDKYEFKFDTVQRRASFGEEDKK